MKRINSIELLESLMNDTRQLILEANKLKPLTAKDLQFQPSANSWSIAQVLEHLNFYSQFYLKAIEEKIHLKETSPDTLFKPSWFGNYFTKMMKPNKENEVNNKMKTSKNATPPSDVDGKSALDKFISDQHILLNLLQIAHNNNLNKIRVPISITTLIKLKLGDTFRFFIAHEQRHMLQIQKLQKLC